MNAHPGSSAKAAATVAATTDRSSGNACRTSRPPSSIANLYRIGSAYRCTAATSSRSWQRSQYARPYCHSRRRSLHGPFVHVSPEVARQLASCLPLLAASNEAQDAAGLIGVLDLPGTVDR